VATVVVPFRSGGKSRLPAAVRVDLALAMLGDVLEAAAMHDREVRLVTGDPGAVRIALSLGAEVIADPGGGQGAAVEAALLGAAGTCLVVNADLPRIRPSDLTALAYAPHAGAAAIVPAADGTTNALGLPHAEVFQPLYGPESAAQFRAHVIALGVFLHDLDLPNLRADVDTADDLKRMGSGGGRRTRALMQVVA